MTKHLTHMASVLALCIVSIQSAYGQGMTDTRLIGKWHSDAQKTAQLRINELRSNDESLEKFELTYGHQIKIFTANRLEINYSTTPGKKLNDAYQVIAKDSKSVVIEVLAPTGKQLQQFFFEGDYMYVLFGYRVEYFKRIK